jgi:superfamily I DNA/RNA helicase
MKRIHLFPFSDVRLVDRVASVYSDLLEDHDVSDVLILKRSSTGLRELRESLRTKVGIVEEPAVESLIGHAQQTLQEIDNPPKVLSQYERRELLASTIEEHEWESKYLHNASKQPSFERDVGQFSVPATWSGMPDDIEDPVLEELTEVNEKLHENLEENGYAEIANVVSKATDALEDDEVRDNVQSEFDVVLVLELEDFNPRERDYLRNVTKGVPAVGIAEKYSSIQKVWNEPREVHHYLSDFEVIPENSKDPETLPDAVAQYFVGSQEAQIPEQNGLYKIEERTFAEQVETVAEEIERLRDERGWEYDDFAVVLRDSSSPIRETVNLLTRAGIPTSSISVSGLKQSTAVRELYNLALYLNSEDEDALKVLEARVSESKDVLSEVGNNGVLEGLYNWILKTDLKRRISEQEDEIEARNSFAHVEEVLDLADFIREYPEYEPAWERFVSVLERAFRYSSPDKYLSDLDIREGGVFVDSARESKNSTWKAVFALNLVEGEYPTDPRINSLFPSSMLSSVPEYPAVTSPTEEDVTKTFPIESSDSPFSEYYENLYRRVLGVVAGSAKNRLYIGTYSENSSEPGKYKQPSRFLNEIEENFPVEPLEHDSVYSEGKAIEFAVGRVEDSLNEIRSAPVTGEEVEVTDIERDLMAVQKMLNENSSEVDMSDVIEARIDFLEGRVRRD